MRTRLIRHFYVRIWLALVGAVVATTLLFAWFWHLDAEQERAQRPIREVVLHNERGDVIGHSVERPVLVPGQGMEFAVQTRDRQTLYILLPSLAERDSAVHPAAWGRPPLDWVWLLGLVAMVVALGARPIVRRLTRRLEALQQGVERWGEGELGRRLPEDGHDEVAYLARRFNIAAERVHALLLAHKSLLANASHELRSPLTRIRMRLELMQGQPTAAAGEEMARDIRELDGLIDEILLASRLDASPNELGAFEPVDLLGLCAEECARADADFDAASSPNPLLVSGIIRLLGRALRNLLENARRHGAGEVTLQLLATDTQALVRVSDRGPGVPAELRERIFEPFYRLPGASEGDGGVGLGLSLVRSIAERHGGTVHCEDSPGGGACFVLALPRLR